MSNGKPIITVSIMFIKQTVSITYSMPEVVFVVQHCHIHNTAHMQINEHLHNKTYYEN